MIDFGLVMTDLDGKVLDSLFVRIAGEGWRGAATRSTSSPTSARM